MTCSCNGHLKKQNILLFIKVRVVILADHSLEDIFVHGGDHDHDESHILMDDLGLKRVSKVEPAPLKKNGLTRSPRLKFQTFKCD